MSHISARSAYKSLEERINRFPHGAPPSDTLYRILETLFSEREATLVAQLPIRPFTTKKAAAIWGVSLAEADKVLRGLASRCILLDIETESEVTYVLPPPMAGFFEFSLMRTRDDVDQRLLSELFHQYMHVEEDFIKELFFQTDTRAIRAFVNEEAVLTSEHAVHILDHQRASHIIESARHIGVSMCYCRHKAEHLGKNCAAPVEDICLTFGNTADALIRHAYARRIDAAEGMDILQKAYAHQLVQTGENVRSEVAFLCNCCGCCCEALTAVRNFGSLHPIETTGFLPELNTDSCVGCGKCEKACQIRIIEMRGGERGKRPSIRSGECIGCGLCARACPNRSLTMRQTDKRIITPANSVHRIVLMAIERGRLQELIFDNKALTSHRAMAAILSAILKLPPVKRAMASQQMRSVYLERLLVDKNSANKSNDYSNK